MTLLIYISYSSKLSQEDKLNIDAQVLENRKNVRLIVKKFTLCLRNKSKKMVVTFFLLVIIYFSTLQQCEGVCLPVPSPAISTVHKNHENKVEIAETIKPKISKITYKELPISIYMVDDKFLKTSGTRKMMNKIRGGTLIEGIAIGLLIIFTCQLIGLKMKAESFIVDNQNPRLELGRLKRFQPTGSNIKYPPVYNLFPSQKTSRRSELQIFPPSSMPHQQFVGLTKEGKRQVSHIDDMKMEYEGHPKLLIGFWQAEFKVKDHGALHDLPFEINSNGQAKSQNNYENTLKMIKSIFNMPKRNNVKWFEDGTYQGGTDRGYPAIHVYDLDKQIIAVFKKSNGRFVTTCHLDDDEHEELLQTKNFGGNKQWLNGRPKNLPPKPNNNDVTSVNLMDKSPVSDVTPKNSFENDIMRITPITESQDNL